MRLVAVALVAIAPLLVFARGQTWTALKQQWSWPLHWGGGSDGSAPGWEIAAGAPITGDARLINYLPDDAEVVLWLRATQEFLDAMAKQFSDAKQERDPDAPQEVMVALRKDGFLAIVRSRKGLEEIDQEGRERLEKELAEHLFAGKRIPLLVYSAQPDLHVVVTENWDAAVRARAAGTRPAPAELLALLDGTPRDAPLVAAAHDASVAGVLVDRGTGHMRVADKGLHIETNLNLASATAAGLLRSVISSSAAEAKNKVPDSCKEPVDKLNRGIQVSGEGTRVVVSAKLGFEELMAAMFCQLGSDDSE
jgi:hypothetical protein